MRAAPSPRDVGFLSKERGECGRVRVRFRVISAFGQLSENGKINTDDPILIYFAGHGTQLKVPPGWEAGGRGCKIQGICPCDYKRKDVDTIPDRTIGGLLDLICEKKGNNIVFYRFH